MTTNDWYIEQVMENPFIGEKAKKTYHSSIKAVMSICNNESIHVILHNAHVNGQMILSSTIPDESKKTYLTAILTFLRTSGLKTTNKALFLEWYSYYERISDIITFRVKNNIPTERQEKNAVDWQYVIKVRDSLPYGSMPHLVLSLYSYVPPRRQMDYMALRIYNKADEIIPLNHNHLHLYSNKYNAPYMYIHNFKGSEHRKKKFFNKEIPTELVKVIKASMRKQPRDYLFAKADGTPYEIVNSFTQFSNRILKRIFNNEGMTVNVLRHSFATYSSTIPNITVGEREKNAIKMGHSLKKALEYAFRQQDPPWSMYSTQSNPSNRKEECYKKDVKTNKIVKIPCPPSS
jgi:hypothetical protein